MSYLRQFVELSRDDIDLAGGKGANLGELIRAGLPVRDGFVLTTDAYRDFVDAVEIGASVQELATNAVEAELESTAQQIRALFTGRSIPADLRAEIAAGYAQLGDDIPVAVRSSATSEDLPDASFAGQQETYPNVWTGPGAGGRARVLGLVVDGPSHGVSAAARHRPCSGESGRRDSADGGSGGVRRGV